MRSVPDRYRTRTLASFIPVNDNTRRAKDAAERVVRGEFRSMVLVGPPGAGKTHLAAAIWSAIHQSTYGAWQEARIRALAELMPPPPFYCPEWCNVAELVSDLRGEMGSELHSARDRSVRLRSYPALVVLDDLGREKASEWTGELIYVLVNARYEAGLPTVATSNLGPDELTAAGYWPAISRLAEDGVLFRVDAPDHRLRGRAATARVLDQRITG